MTDYYAEPGVWPGFDHFFGKYGVANRKYIKISIEERMRISPHHCRTATFVLLRNDIKLSE